MKIGILTLTGSDNYGNVLQNYAVQEILSELGAKAETIKNSTKYGHYSLRNKNVCKWTPSYINMYIHNQLNYRYNIKNTGEGILKTVYYYKKNLQMVEEAKEKRKNAFADFTEKRIIWADRTIDINYPWAKEQIDDYDFYVSGSDQVWNPVYPSTSSINFLQFAPKEKRIAFSPSFGVNEIPLYLQKQYAKWLEEIPHLSVREEQGKRIIDNLCGRSATVLCDPAIVLEKKKWISIEKRPEFLTTDKYILTYFLGDRSKEYDQFINKVARENDLQIIHLFDVMNLQSYSTSPEEFLYLIRNASLVCTDSFHGAVFSIIMNTNFVTFSRIESGGSMESRMVTLLSTFSLEQREHHKIQKEQLFKTDFKDANIMIEKKRQEAIDFLRSAIGEKKSEEQKLISNVILYEEKKKCCGCNACVNSCPMQCISMKEDSEGFYYPEIARDKCVNCGQCQKVCPVKEDLVKENLKSVCYVGSSMNPEIQKNSSSGGIFNELAEEILKQGGHVFGAAFDKNFSVIHQEATSIEELFDLCGSKYAQSQIGDVYRSVRSLLEQGEKVYFSGTPCQIKGLHSFLDGKHYDNLYTQDIVCHGVPSPGVWRKYLECFKNRHNICKVSFRDKKYGWHYFSLLIQGKVRNYRKRLDEDCYLRLFLDNTILRPICYDCPIKKEGSCADITLADCWKPERISAEIKDTDKGISLVIIHTPKGISLWEDAVASGDIAGERVDTEKAIRSQQAILVSASPNLKRAAFFEAINNEDEYSRVLKNWYRDSFSHRLRRKIIYYKSRVKFLLKNILRTQ